MVRHTRVCISITLIFIALILEACLSSNEDNFQIRKDPSVVIKVSSIDSLEDGTTQCQNLLDDKKDLLALPAYHQCIKASHIFNLLDARGVISVSERQSYILRVRNMARSSCLAWMGKLNE